MSFRTRNVSTIYDNNNKKATTSNINYNKGLPNEIIQNVYNPANRRNNNNKHIRKALKTNTITNAESFFNQLFFNDSINVLSYTEFCSRLGTMNNGKFRSFRDKLFTLSHEELSFVTGLTLVEVLLLIIFLSDKILGVGAKEVTYKMLEQLVLDKSHANEILQITGMEISSDSINNTIRMTDWTHAVPLFQTCGIATRYTYLLEYIQVINMDIEKLKSSISYKNKSHYNKNHNNKITDWLIIHNNTTDKSTDNNPKTHNSTSDSKNNGTNTKIINKNVATCSYTNRFEPLASINNDGKLHAYHIDKMNKLITEKNYDHDNKVTSFNGQNTKLSKRDNKKYKTHSKISTNSDTISSKYNKTDWLPIPNVSQYKTTTLKTDFANKASLITAGRGVFKPLIPRYLSHYATLASRFLSLICMDYQKFIHIW